jgi:Mor family transcriptional regulator
LSCARSKGAHIADLDPESLYCTLPFFCTERIMGYVKANGVLPEKLLAAVQEYADGTYLYIPRKTGARKKWGEVKRTRDMLQHRNRKLYGEYLNGVSVARLADRYCLADKTVYKIIAELKRNT